MKRLLEILAALLIIGVLGSCNLVVGPNEPVGNSFGGGDSGGTLTISFGEDGAANSRAITSGADLPGDVLAGMKYDLILTGPNNETIERTVSGGETLSLTVTPGQWRIDSQGYYLDVLAGTGSVTISVLAGENPVRIPMMMSGPCYEVTVDPGIVHGAVQTNFTLAFEGTPITLTAAPDSGSGLKAGTFKYNDGSDHVIAGLVYAFAMPASDVRVSAEFEPLYSITLGSFTGGTVTADFASAMAGAAITLTVEPLSGYALKDNTLRYNDGTIDHVIAGPSYTFAMPASDVTVSAEFIQFVRYVTQYGAGSKDGMSWANASDDIQKMMDELAAIPSSDYAGPRIVKAAAGTYTPLYEPMVPASLAGPYVYNAAPGDNRDKAFILRQGVQVWGGYPASGGDDANRNIVTNETILSGDIGAPNSIGDNVYHVVVGVNIPAGSGTVLDGLTVTEGNADGSGSAGGISRSNGGGMSNSASAPALINVTISGNSAKNGGGMYNANSSAPALINVIISGNSAAVDGGSTSSFGGGMYNNSSSPVLTNVLISGNTVSVAGGSSSIFGGGMYNDNSSPALTNVTIAGNIAGGGHGACTLKGGGMYNKNSSSPQIRNSVIWGNAASSGDAGICNESSTPAISYSIVQGIDTTNPLFETLNQASVGSDSNCTPYPTTGGDYRLKTGSPAINAGSDALYPNAAAIGTQIGVTFSADLEAAINTALAKDLAGVNRKNGPIDMGAYEKN
jgi:hypothetical protein